MVDVGLEALSPHALTPLSPTAPLPVTSSTTPFGTSSASQHARINERAATIHRIASSKVRNANYFLLQFFGYSEIPA